MQVHEGRKHADDDVGALYYVIAVIFIYGCSILMMIASYIRKNKTDRKLNRYLKEMANVRKRERQMQLLNATAKAATITQSENKSGKLPGITETKEKTGTTKDPKKEPPKLTFRLDTAGPQKLYSDRVYLDLPVSSFSYNSDSDNETSTEGEPILQSTPITSHQRSPSQKSILKKTRSKSVTLTIERDNEWSKTDLQASPLQSSKDAAEISGGDREEGRRSSVSFEENVKDINEEAEPLNATSCDTTRELESPGNPTHKDDIQVVSTV